VTTIRDILFGGRKGSAVFAGAQAAQQLAASGAIPVSQGYTTNAVAQQMMTVVGSALDIPVSDVLVGAWRTRSALHRAARESVGMPRVYRMVSLHSCRIPWDNIIDVGVALNGAAIVSATFTARMDFRISALAAIVQNGCLTGFNSGAITVTAQLLVQMHQPVQVSLIVAEAEATLDLGPEFRFGGRGISLIPEAGSAYLLVIDGPLTGVRVSLGSAGAVIGRADGCTLRLDDVYVSSRHAQITHSGTDWIVRDCGSTNGTYVNGIQISGPAQVPPGTSIRIGHTTLEVRQ